MNKIDRSEAPEGHSGAFLRLYLPRRTPPVPPGAGIVSISQGTVPTPLLSKNPKFVPSRSCSLLQRAFERESSAFNPAKGAADFRPFRRILLARKFRLRRPAGPASPPKRGKGFFYGTGFSSPSGALSPSPARHGLTKARTATPSVFADIMCSEAVKNSGLIFSP